MKNAPRNVWKPVEPTLMTKLEPSTARAIVALRIGTYTQRRSRVASAAPRLDAAASTAFGGGAEGFVGYRRHSNAIAASVTMPTAPNAQRQCRNAASSVAAGIPPIIATVVAVMM